MIQKLTLKNFLSFKDEVTFSFEASNDKFAEDFQVVKINEQTRLLRFAVVYGYNASGKSNLLKAFEFLKSFWFNVTTNPNQKTNVKPFKLDRNSVSEPTVFDLVFFVGKSKYRYQLELDENQVYFEKLSYYETVQPTMLFERKLENNISVIKFNSVLKISEVVKEIIDGNCLKNMSFFAARQRTNANIKYIDEAVKYLQNNITPVITPDANLSNEIGEIINNKELRSHILDFLGSVSFNISDIRKQLSVNGNTTIFEHTVENENGKETFAFNMGDDSESQGTMRIICIESIVHKALQNNSLMAIDEVETSIHSKLLEKTIYNFFLNESSSQLIVTTHNDGLLDMINDLIRKDSVWFTEKQKSGATELFKLTDFRGLNKIPSIREAYILKRFGATIG